MDRLRIPRTQRMHDVLYLHEDCYERPKDVSKEAVALAREWQLNENGHIGDFGCETGELLYFLKPQFPNCTLRGVDDLPELISRARERVLLASSASDPSSIRRQPRKARVTSREHLASIIDTTIHFRSSKTSALAS